MNDLTVTQTLKRLSLLSTCPALDPKYKQVMKECHALIMGLNAGKDGERKVKDLLK
jgi:hypothetical protein